MLETYLAVDVYLAECVVSQTENVKYKLYIPALWSGHFHASYPNFAMRILRCSHQASADVSHRITIRDAEQRTSIPSFLNRPKIEFGPRHMVLFWHSKMMRIW